MYSPGKKLQDPDDEEDQLEDGGFLISAAFSSKNITYDTLMQDGFSLSSPAALKSAKKRKAKVAEIHGGGGGAGRIVRAAGRKDRHSKVSTARGPRDRRLRLSPRTAIQFYDVQDRLGYDRPSKAIDWLIKEAKAAIDALEEPPPAATAAAFLAGKNCTFTNEKNQQMQQGVGGFFIPDENPDSGFSFLVDGAAPPPCTAEMQAYADGVFNPPSRNGNANPDQDPNLYQGFHQGFFSDWEIARLQKLLTADNSSSGNSPPLHFPAAAVSGGGGEIFSQREPLQSSVINCSPINSAHFPGLSFSSELSKITAVGAIKEGEKEKKTVSSRPSFTAPFLH